METKVIATKFVRHDVPELATLQNCKGLPIKGKTEQRRKVEPSRKKLACRSSKPKRLFQKSRPTNGLSLWF